MGDTRNMKYVLVTPARNEEAYIRETIEAVVNQTHLPERWVIVSDGSTDRTEEIVREYEREHSFITLLCAQGRGKRSFGSKALAFKAGYEIVTGASYEFIGNLDADVTFARTYYERMLEEFSQNPRLGVAGGIIAEEWNGGLRKSRSAIHHAAGAMQLFRRECFEQIGGYVPMRTGGIDSVALIMARMKGWETRMFRDMEVLHHRKEGSALGAGLRLRFRQGETDYNLGSHPVFIVVKGIRRLMEKPYVISSAARMCGFFWSWLRRPARDVPEDVVRYYRKEQMRRLRRILFPGDNRPLRNEANDLAGACFSGDLDEG